MPVQPSQIFFHLLWLILLTNYHITDLSLAMLHVQITKGVHVRQLCRITCLSLSNELERQVVSMQLLAIYTCYFICSLRGYCNICAILKNHHHSEKLIINVMIFFYYSICPDFISKYACTCCDYIPAFSTLLHKHCFYKTIYKCLSLIIITND